MQLHFRFPWRLFTLALFSVALTIAASIPAHDAGAASHPIVWGDVTCNNIVDLQDVSDLMRRASGLESSTNCPGDIPPAAAGIASASAVTLRLDPPLSSAGNNDTITIGIYSDVHVAGTGIGNASFDVPFDPNKLTPIACVANNGDCSLLFTPNTTRFGFLNGSAEGWTGTKKLGQVQYLVRSSSGTTNISFASIKVGDQHGTLLTTDSMGATVTLGVSSVTPTPAPTPVPTPAPSIAPGTYWHYADIDCDDVVNVADALVVLSYLALGGQGQGTAGGCPAVGS